MKKVVIDFYKDDKVVFTETFEVMSTKKWSYLEVAFQNAIQFMDDNGFDMWDYKP